MFCHGEKECHEMEQLRQNNQQETCSRRSVVTCCFPCSSPWSAWASKRRCPGEALLLVVKVVQVVFPCVHVDSAGNVFKAKRCYLLFPLQQSLICMGLEEAISWRSVVTCCKSCSSCFPMCPRRFSRKRVQGEALLLVVSLAAVLDLHGPRRGNILAKRCSLL